MALPTTYDALKIVFNEPFPETFKSSAECHDSTRVGGFDFPKKVKDTDYARSKCIAGMRIEEIPLLPLLWQGKHTWDLRLVMNGRFFAVHLSRNLAESLTIQGLLWAIREDASKNKRDTPPREADSFTDLSVLCSSYAAHHKLAYSTNSDKKKASEHMGHTMIELLRNTLPRSEPDDVKNRLRKLEEENEKLKQQLLTPEQKLKAALQQNSTPKKHTASSAPVTPAEPEHPLEEVRRAAGKHKLLAASAPTGSSQAAVNKWVASLKLSKQQSAHVSKMIQRLTQQVDKTEDLVKAMIESMLKDWGLPDKLSSSMAFAPALQVLVHCHEIIH